MYHRVRRKMNSLIISAILILANHPFTLSKSIVSSENPNNNVDIDDNFENNIIDFDEEYSIKFNKKYGTIPWHANDFKKDTHRYTISNDLEKKIADIERKVKENINIDKQNITEIENSTNTNKEEDATSTIYYSVIPLELLSTTENILISLVESTAEPDLTVIPLSTTETPLNIVIDETITLPTSTQVSDSSIYTDSTTENDKIDTTEQTADDVLRNNKTIPINLKRKVIDIENVTKEQSIENTTSTNIFINTSTVKQIIDNENMTRTESLRNATVNLDETNENINKTDDISRSDPSSTELDESDLPLFTELDAEDVPDVPEDYYDSKDVVPTTAPKTDAISVIFGLAGSVVESVVESVAERVVPKSIFDLFKRMQRQNEALEAERLRSREENGGLGQFGRGILKSISSGLTKPLSQLMAGAKDIGSLDNDKGFVGSLASGVTSVANVATSVVDTFKDRVQAIYPGTVWCGDGRSATARSSDLGLFFFTDTCCRQHDACKLYIKSGDTKYGLTNTGLFTRSHCSCDAKFRECLMRTNSLVSAQIGLTYFNVLGPQCFRRAHPIVRCVRRTRITGQKCEEYELDYTKPRMWQWFDNETF